MMLIPAHREVMNLVYYQDKSIEEVCRPDKHRQDANVLRASSTGGVASRSGREGPWLCSAKCLGHLFVI